MKMHSNLQESILEATTYQVHEMAIEYGHLTSLTQLTDAQSERLQEILDCACNDGVLSFWIGELDHIIGHETGLLTPDRRKDYENKKALLQEYFIELLESCCADKSPGEVKAFLECYLAKEMSGKSEAPLSSNKRSYSGADTYQTQNSHEGLNTM